MTDAAVESVLRLVSDGLLTADEAGPILDALEAADRYSQTEPATAASGGSSDPRARAIRIEVSDAGRTIVNLRVPLALGRAALDRIPGLTETITDRVRDAIANGIKGAILDVDDDGDGVRIFVE